MKYGHDAYGAMPYEMFARRVFSGQAHQLSLEGCKKRAFDANNDKLWTWQGMIKYPQCRTGVFAPADWEDYAAKTCRRSACHCSASAACPPPPPPSYSVTCGLALSVGRPGSCVRGAPYSIPWS